MGYWIGYFIFWVLSVLFFPIRVYGRENFPKSGSFILAPNHLSNLDPFIVGLVVGKRTSYLAKEELFENKTISFILRQLGAFPVKRHKADIGAMKESLKRIKKGPLLVFPEGTRQRGESKQEPFSGISWFSTKGNVPIIPVFVRGSDKVLPPGAKFFKRCSVEVYLGKAVNFSKNAPRDKVARQIMHDIYALDQKK